MESLIGNNSRRPDITFHANGRIDITARISRWLGVEDGDVIDIIHDNGEYFLTIREKHDDIMGKHEAQCWASNKQGRNYRAYSSKLCNAIIKMTGHHDCAKLPAGEMTTIGNAKAVTLIVKNNLAII